MSGKYGSAKVCPFDNQNCDLEMEGLSLEPGLEAILADTSNRDWDELVYIWKGWRDSSGKQMREIYMKYIELNNDAAVANGMLFCEILLAFY